MAALKPIKGLKAWLTPQFGSEFPSLSYVVIKRDVTWLYYLSTTILVTIINLKSQIVKQSETQVKSVGVPWRNGGKPWEVWRRTWSCRVGVAKPQRPHHPMFHRLYCAQLTFTVFLLLLRCTQPDPTVSKAASDPAKSSSWSFYGILQITCAISSPNHMSHSSDLLETLWSSPGLTRTGVLFGEWQESCSHSALEVLILQMRRTGEDQKVSEESWEQDA